MKGLLAISAALLLGFAGPAMAGDQYHPLQVEQISTICKSVDPQTGVASLTAIPTESKNGPSANCPKGSLADGFELAVESVHGVPPPPDELNERYGKPPYQPGGDR